MKASTYLFAVLLSFFVLFGVSASAELAPEKKKNTEQKLTKQEFAEAYQSLKNRINQLKEDKKNARTRLEKQQILEEIRGIKEEAKELKQQQSGGIYIGAGALVVILLLVLLL